MHLTCVGGHSGLGGCTFLHFCRLAPPAGPSIFPAGGMPGPPARQEIVNRGHRRPNDQRYSPSDECPLTPQLAIRAGVRPTPLKKAWLGLALPTAAVGRSGGRGPTPPQLFSYPAPPPPQALAAGDHPKRVGAARSTVFRAQKSPVLLSPWLFSWGMCAVIYVVLLLFLRLPLLPPLAL